MFLANTLSLYKIGLQFTRVALYTFDHSYELVFELDSFDDWFGLYEAIGNKWQYGPAHQHGPERQLSK